MKPIISSSSTFSPNTQHVRSIRSRQIYLAKDCMYALGHWVSNDRVSSTPEEKNRVKLQQIILLAISICDFLSSAAWIFTDFFMPPKGNQQSCDAQGFLIQFVNSSNMMLMVSLQVQYILVIKYGWSDRKINKLKPYFLILPLGFGALTATVSLVLKLFNPAYWDCWLMPYPADCTSTYEIKHGMSDLEESNCVRGDNAFIFQWAFFFAPLWAATVICFVVMYKMTKSVEEAEIKTARYSGKSNRNVQSKRRQSIQAINSEGRLTLTELESTLQDGKIELVLTKRVKMQCIMYALGFVVVWGFKTIARLIQLFGGTVPPVFFPLAAFFLGSQGLWNALIYFRPKYFALEEDHWWQKVWIIVRSSLFCCTKNRRSGGSTVCSIMFGSARSSFGAITRSFRGATAGNNNNVVDNIARTDKNIGDSFGKGDEAVDVEAHENVGLE
mmetsp:Transcript_17730/g.36983  ORF Transcript_17730/g.36983 Transcript_17730/m.36983 type:complete len:442 (+) Transcript_17730:39-1364(+)